MYKDTDAPALAKTFTDFVDKYGRSFEFGLATRYHLLNRPLSMHEDGADGHVHVHPRPHGPAAHARSASIDQLAGIIEAKAQARLAQD